MTTSYRVFSKSDQQPDPRPLGELANTFNTPVEGVFYGDDEGWTKLELKFAKRRSLVTIERYLAEEEELRQSFRTWAAWIESANEDPANDWLMEHMINTQQLFTIEAKAKTADQPFVKDVCTEMARYLARQTEGIYQIDDQGFFAADGKLLVREDNTDESDGEQ
jgi:hypothetical protein